MAVPVVLPIIGTTCNRRNLELWKWWIGWSFLKSLALKLSGKILTLRDELLLLLQRVEEPNTKGGGKQLRATICMSKLGCFWGAKKVNIRSWSSLGKMRMYRIGNECMNVFTNLFIYKLGCLLLFKQRLMMVMFYSCCSSCRPVFACLRGLCVHVIIPLIYHLTIMHCSLIPLEDYKVSWEFL